MERGKIKIDGKTLTIEAPPHVSIRLRRLFGGAQRYRAGVFQLSATPQQAYDLEWFRQRHPMDLEPGSEERFRELVAMHEKRLSDIAQFEDVGYIPAEFDLALPPRMYQREAADLAVKTGNLLIADDLGLGKTVSAICALTAPAVLPAVVVTMTHLQRQWERELARFAPKLRVHRIRKGRPYMFEEIKTEKGPDGRRRVVKVNTFPDVVVLNYHKLDGWVEALAPNLRTLVFDEVQELRRSDSMRYRAASALTRAAQLRIGLSATPIYNYGEEIYNVITAIAPDQLGTHREFLEEWCDCDRSENGKAMVADPAALGTYLRESGLMIRRTRKEVGRELPALSVVRHVVEADQGKLNEIALDVAELAKRVLKRIGSPIEQAQGARDLDWRLRQATGIAKAPAVAEFVRLLVESGERVVLFAWHHEVYAIYRAEFEKKGIEIPYAMYTGQESDAQKDAARKAFIDGEAKVLIISLRAGAGLDGLQFVSRTVVIGELDWSPQVIWQDIGRVHRDGQTEPVCAYILVSEDGSDPVIADVLGLKESQAQGIINPDQAGDPVQVGAAEDRIRKLAEDVLRRRGITIDN